MPVSIAYIYSALDYSRYCIDRFDSHLNGLRGELVSDIYSRSVQPGDSISTTDNPLEKADIVLVLVSADFRNMPYFQNGAEIRRVTARYEQSNRSMELILLLLDNVSLPVTPLPPNVRILPADGSVAVQASRLSPDSNSYSVIYERVVRDIKDIAIATNGRKPVSSPVRLFPLVWIPVLMGTTYLTYAVTRAIVLSQPEPEPTITVEPTITPTERPTPTITPTPPEERTPVPEEKRSTRPIKNGMW
ncbi:MAG: hypothetical protein KME27_03815 [Lyngbya sp. HA4199-MV5]|jgi:hypothetical protein|nr:hypothetical protein [Lyngbya sp. HA4199-MV5]